MTRFARVVASGYPHHVVHRGNNRAKTFLDWRDYEQYLDFLKKYCLKWKSPLLAYCLMPNHIHLLIKPDTEISLPKMMQGIALCYARYINRKYRRTGRLWESRYFSSVVDREDYLWTVVRYIEQNPLRAKMTVKEIDYPYSSARAHLLGEKDDLLGEAIFDENERREYIRFAAESASKREIKSLRSLTRKGKPLSDEPNLACYCRKGL